MLPNISVKDIIDLALVLGLVVYVYRMTRESRAIYVLTGILLVVALWLVVDQVLEMRLLGSIMNQLINVGVIAVIVIFQEEIRRFLYKLGAHRRVQRVMRLFGLKAHGTKDRGQNLVMPIVLACSSMARQKVGALIVIERAISLKDIADGGELVDAAISQQLIENIFFKGSPLHDGAMIISNGRIKQAGAILPVAHDEDIPREFGLRHRSALGVSQQSDAIAVVVSEETGRITVAISGGFRMKVSAEELESILTI